MPDYKKAIAMLNEIAAIELGGGNARKRKVHTGHRHRFNIIKRLYPFRVVKACECGKIKIFKKSEAECQRIRAAILMDNGYREIKPNLFEKL